LKTLPEKKTAKVVLGESQPWLPMDELVILNYLKYWKFPKANFIFKVPGKWNT
jgi:hypothetical protein